MMHSQRVGIAISHLLQLLVEVCPIQPLRLLVGKVGKKSELSSESLLVWTEVRVQVWSCPKAQQDHRQPTQPILVVLAVAGNAIFECPMPALHYTVGLGKTGWCGFTANP